MLIYGVGLMLVLLSCCGLALDLGSFEITKLKMQNAADAAAMGAVTAYEDGSLLTGGYTEATQNGFTDGVNGVTVTLAFPPASGAYAGNTQAIQVIITKPVTGIFIRKTFTLSAQATAVGVPTACVYMLSKFSTQPSLLVQNQQNSTTCPFYAGASYTYSGSATSSGSSFYVAGPGTNSSGSVAPNPTFGAPRMYDPLASLAVPTFTTCDHTNFAVAAAATLQPGTYCGGLTITTSSTVTLNPGLYIILGSLTINGPTLVGAGVTLFLSQGNGYTYGGSSIQNVNATLSAPTTGTWQGILYYSDRTLPAGQATLSLANWNPNTRIDGIFYLYGQEFLASNVTLVPKQYLAFVADYLNMHNTNFVPTANYNSLANGNPFRPIGGGAGIVE